jgi:hypothetical protein
MDVWVQRCAAVGLVITAIAMLLCMLEGQDGKLLGLLSGIIVGLFATLGIGNIFVKNDIEKLFT